MTKDEIKNLRIALGKTQEQFALLVGTTLSNVSRWENGVTQPRGLYLKALENLAREQTSTKH